MTLPRDDPQRQEVVDLIERNLLPLQLLVDRPEALDAAVDRHDRDLRFVELRREPLPELVDQSLGGAPARFDLVPERLVGGRLDVPERQFLQLVLQLAHAQPMGDRRVDVAGLLRDADAPFLGQVVQRPHVVQPVGELDENHADVVDHRQQHLAEALRLALLARRELEGGQLGDALDHVRHLLPEQFPDLFDRVGGVLDNVVQEAGRDGDHVQPHVRQEVGDLQRVHQIRLAGSTDLSLVLVGGEDVGPPEQLGVGVRIGRAHLLEQIFEPDHGCRCLTEMDGFGAKIRRTLPT